MACKGCNFSDRGSGTLRTSALTAYPIYDYKGQLGMILIQSSDSVEAIYLNRENAQKLHGFLGRLLAEKRPRRR